MLRALYSVRDKMYELDRFPVSVKLNFNKKESMPSFIGFFMTLVCYTLVFIYAVQRF